MSQTLMLMSPHPATTRPSGCSNDMLLTHNMEGSPSRRLRRQPGADSPPPAPPSADNETGPPPAPAPRSAALVTSHRWMYERGSDEVLAQRPPCTLLAKMMRQGQEGRHSANSLLSGYRATGLKMDNSHGKGSNKYLYGSYRLALFGDVQGLDAVGSVHNDAPGAHLVAGGVRRVAGALKLPPHFGQAIGKQLYGGRRGDRQGEGGQDSGAEHCRDRGSRSCKQCASNQIHIVWTLTIQVFGVPKQKPPELRASHKLPAHPVHVNAAHRAVGVLEGDAVPCLRVPVPMGQKRETLS